MPIEKINIDHFLNLSRQLPILDVRSPSEFSHAHIPGAFSVPIFTDEQRATIGTAYVQQSRQEAVDHGLNYFSERMKIIPGEAVNIFNDHFKNKNQSEQTILKDSDLSILPALGHIGTGSSGFLVHCWRGGMRSEAVAWLLSLYGHRVFLLKGGYKAFRKWGLAQFEKKYFLKILGGHTGSGKTEILKELRRSGKKIIDLELLANHKGSAFGALGESPQPTHEMFENLLAIELWKVANTEGEKTEIWLEDESVHIGRVGIPKVFWGQMRKSPLFFVDIPFEERLNYIAETYGVFTKEQLTDCILRIQKRLGGLNTKNAIHLLSENKTRESFAILLTYYDKFYESGLYKRENIFSLLNKVTCTGVSITNAKKLNNQ